jgi:ubiquinone biosynthesis protein Coq4
LTTDTDSSNNQVTIHQPTVNHCNLPTLRRLPNDR